MVVDEKKKTRQWNGGVDALSMRVDMVNLLTPFNSAAHIKKHESTFKDIHEFVLSVEAPKYPFPVDQALAGKGRILFEETCARCHGSFEPNAEYPNKVVSLEAIGTDPILAQAISEKNVVAYNTSWFAEEKTPDGKPIQVTPRQGYQAPPLDGVWATAPYFHNASVPTIYHVLNSKARPKYYTRSYGTEKQDYDQRNMGVHIRVLENAPPANLPGIERRRIYDTTLPGQSNQGHTFGDHLSDRERRAIIEFLKTV